MIKQEKILIRKASSNESTKMLLGTIGVIFCLYCFLCGINGLSDAIKSMTQPDTIVLDDMIQIKDSDGKKVWVQVSSINNEIYTYTYKGEQKTTSKKSIIMVANSTFIKATSSAVIALFIGVFATVLFQSSSTTTSLIVGMAGSGII